MAEDIQGLLDRIQTDGVEKAEAEKARILSEAEKQAASIVASARAEAEKIRKDAEADAAVSETKGKAAVQQAARDVMIALEADLQNRLQSVAKSCAGKAMTTELMGKIILEMVRAYAAGNPSAGTPAFEVLVPESEAAEMESLLKGGLLANLHANPVVRTGGDFGAGLQIGFKDSDAFFDFSDGALSEIICKYVGPKLASAIRG